MATWRTAAAGALGFVIGVAACDDDVRVKPGAGACSAVEECAAAAPVCREAAACADGARHRPSD